MGMKENTYLVTGGCGFIGSMLCKKLAEKNRKVVVVDSLANGRRELVERLGPRVTLEVADLRDAKAMATIMERVRPSAVCHLAAIHFIPYCNQHPQEAVETNITGTLNVFEACRAHPPRMVVFASTAAVYAPSDDRHKETDAIDPIDVYGMTKRACEDLGKIYAMQSGAGCIGARIFNAVGPNESNPHFVPALIQQLLQGKRKVFLGNLEPSRDYISTSDLATALISLMDADQKGFDTFNIGTGRGYTVREVVNMCSEILKSPIEIEQRADLIRKVERMSLRADVTKINKATGWRAEVELYDTLKGLLADPEPQAIKS
jgi:UDP-glucose 4-epimerase